MYSIRDTGTGGHLVLSYKFHMLPADNSLVSAAAAVPIESAAPPAVGEAEEEKR